MESLDLETVSMETMSLHKHRLLEQHKLQHLQLSMSSRTKKPALQLIQGQILQHLPHYLGLRTL